MSQRTTSATSCKPSCSKQQSTAPTVSQAARSLILSMYQAKLPGVRALVAANPKAASRALSRRAKVSMNTIEKIRCGLGQPHGHIQGGCPCEPERSLAWEEMTPAEKIKATTGKRTSPLVRAMLDFDTALEKPNEPPVHELYQLAAWHLRGAVAAIDALIEDGERNLVGIQEIADQYAVVLADRATDAEPVSA